MADPASISQKPWTFRVENIPQSCESPDSLKVFFHPEDRDAIVVKSFVQGVGYGEEEEADYTATMLFNSLSPGPRLIDDSLSLDSDFYGFTPLYAPQKGPISADIIAVTGLAGHAYGSWAHSYDRMWLRDYLPRDASTSRILTYGYPSKLQKEDMSASILSDYARAFINRLHDIRQDEQCENRPVVLIGHSLGCLVIKTALTIERARQLPVKGIIFLGAPHRGLQSDVHTILRTLAKGEITESLLMELRSGSPTLSDLNHRFVQIASNIDILTLYETKPTKTIENINGQWKRVGRPIIMVTPDSALLYTSKETSVAAHTDHSHIAKIQKGENGIYPHIKSSIRKCLATGGLPTRTRESNQSSRRGINNPTSETIGTPTAYRENGLKDGFELPVTLNSSKDVRRLFPDKFTLAGGELRYEKALEVCKQTFSAGHAKTLNMMHSLCLIYLEQGILEKAEEICKSALEGRQKILGPEHEDTLRTLHSLGAVYKNQERYTDAESTYQRALEGRQKILGPEHEDTLRTLHNLGVVYYKQERYAEVESTYQRALEGYQKTLGPEHEDTLRTLHSLGVVYGNQERYTDAESTYQRALEGRQKILGPEHEDTLRTLHNLGIVYYNQERYAEAESTYQRALEGYQKTLGPEHKDTLGTLHNLGIVYKNQERYAEAESIYQRALEGRQKTLGPEHKDTLRTLHNLGIVYYNQERYAEAESTYQRALKGRQKTLGPEHEDTLGTLHNLGLVYKNQERYAEAESTYQRALEGYQKTLGPEHKDTLRTLHNLGIVYYNQERYAEAESMYQGALEGYQKTLGPEHEETLGTLYNLGIVYDNQKRYAEAESMYQRALEGRQKTLGPEHEDTLWTLHSLGKVFWQQRKLDEAKIIFQMVLEACNKSQDPMDSLRLQIRSNISAISKRKNARRPKR